MHTPISLNEMRHLILDGFRQHRSEAISSADLEERVRIEDGRVVACCYRIEEFFAMWMVPLGIVQFYDDQGNMLQTLDMTQPLAGQSAPEQRRAAA